MLLPKMESFLSTTDLSPTVSIPDDPIVAIQILFSNPENRILNVQNLCYVSTPDFTEEASIRVNVSPHRVEGESTFGACIRSPAAFLQNSLHSHLLAQSPSGMMAIPRPRRKSALPPATMRPLLHLLRGHPKAIPERTFSA